MPLTSPGPATLRLLACVESFAHEEEGAVGHDDWPALAGLLERELAVIARLAAEQEDAAPADAATLARAQALRDRYDALDERVAAARLAAERECAELDQSGRRLRAVRGAYAAPAARDDDTGRHAAA